MRLLGQPLGQRLQADGGTPWGLLIRVPLFLITRSRKRTLTQEAATGLYGIIGYSEHFLHDRMREGTAAIVQEAEALGDPVVLENLRYILNAPAGSSDLAFQNGWLRDRAPNGSPHWERP